jgi:hypothetical protein
MKTGFNFDSGLSDTNHIGSWQGRFGWWAGDGKGKPEEES